MPTYVTKDVVEQSLREILQSDGYDLSPVGHFSDTGVDVIAIHGNDVYYIEVIGYKSNGHLHAKDFYEAFFRAVSRLKDGAEKCVIALPNSAKRRLPARAIQLGKAWTRIGKAFPELKIWLVDIGKGRIKRSSWNQWGRV